MYCGYCGAELTDEAVFCPSCGQRVAFDFAAHSAGPSTAQCTSDDLPGSATEGSVETFVSAMNRTKAKSRHRMQVIVLVALALMLLSSIAYAAYRAYTTYFAEPTPAVEQPAEVPVEEDPENTEALTAYGEVVAQYHDAIEYYRTSDWSSDALAHVFDTYPLVADLGFGDFIEDSFNRELAETYCSLIDLDGNNVPELLIVLSRDGGYYEGAHLIVVQAYAYYDGGLVELTSSSTRDQYILVQDNRIVEIGSGGAEAGIMNSLRLENGQLVSVEKLEWANAYGSPAPVQVSRTNEDGTVDRWEIGQGEGFPERDEFLVKYVPVTEVKMTSVLDYDAAQELE